MGIDWVECVRYGFGGQGLCYLVLCLSWGSSGSQADGDDGTLVFFACAILLYSYLIKSVVIIVIFPICLTF